MFNLVMSYMLIVLSQFISSILEKTLPECWRICPFSVSENKKSQNPIIRILTLTKLLIWSCSFVHRLSYDAKIKNKLNKINNL